MINTTPEQFLLSKGISLEKSSFNCVIDGYMRQPDICVLLDEYADLKVQEKSAAVNSQQTFVLEVKNINCDFEFLRDGIDKICPSFTIDKDTFIFASADSELYKKMESFRDNLQKHGNHAIVLSRR